MLSEESNRHSSRSWLASLDRAAAWINWGVEGVVWVLVALTTVVTSAQVFFRYALGSSLSWSEELARYLFVWIIFLGTSVAARRHQHIVVDVFVRMFPRSWYRSIHAATTGVSIVFFAILAYVSLQLVQNALYQHSTALDISVAWVYAAAPIGAMLSILYLAVGLVQGPPPGPAGPSFEG
jgi:TRAP-type C4-dicarboxylate transport system permease small subunit